MLSNVTTLRDEMTVIRRVKMSPGRERDSYIKQGGMEGG